MMSVARKPASPSHAADARVTAALAQISDEDMAALAQAIARLLISATKNREQRRLTTLKESAARG